MMDQHTRHIAPTRRRERKTVFADSRWKVYTILPYNICDPQYAEKKKQEESTCDSILYP